MLPSSSDSGLKLAPFGTLICISDIYPVLILRTFLDGGGINVLSESIIVWELMLRIQALYTLVDIPLPCDFFDLICRTGTGGYVLVLIVRLP